MVNMIKEEIQIMEVEDDQPLMFNLVPPEVLLDVFSFTSGIKLSQLKTVHQQFKKLIENYSKTLPDMTVQQLDVVMDRDKYLKGIVLRKDANVSMHFGRVNDFLDFIRGHPMPIKTLVLWNSIWISKFMFYLNDLVPIGEMQLRHNPDSRFHFNTQRGQISFHGCIRPILPLSVDVLMDDYLRYYKTTKNDRRLCHPSPADEPTGGASHLVPPSNFECAVIRMDNEADRLCIGHEDIVDWALDSDYCVPEEDDGGHVLVMEHLNLDVFLPQFIERMIEDIPQRPWPIRPFTLLFKNVPHTRRGRPPFQGPVRQQFPQLGSQFLAGDLHFDEQTQIHTLTATEDNAEAEAMMVDLEELGPLVPDRLTGGGEQFAFVALYRIGGGSCANGEQKPSTAMEQNNSSEEQKYSDEQKPSTSAK